MLKRIIMLGAALMLCLVLSGCVDYVYEFHFNVIGGNGSISTEWNDESPVYQISGNKNGRQLEFVAVPNSGYQVKEWIFNGLIIEGNKSNYFTAKATEPGVPNYITVEFELVD